MSFTNTSILQTVDWVNGRAVIGDNQSEILRMVRQLPAN